MESIKKKNQREIVELKNMLTEISTQMKGLNSKLDNRKKDYYASSVQSLSRVSLQPHESML